MSVPALMSPRTRDPEQDNLLRLVQAQKLLHNALHFPIEFIL